MGKTVAITGASGYIGRMLVERLAARDDIDRIKAIDLGPQPLQSPKVEAIKLDVRDPAIAGAIQGAEIVVHLAFIVTAINNLAETYSINLGGSRNVLSACEDAGIEKLVVASSMAAYGVQPRSAAPLGEDTPLRGDSRSYYLHSKRLVEADLDVFEKRNPEVVVTRLRPSILIGRRNDNFTHEIGRFPFELVVPEGGCLPVVHEEDVIDAFELAVVRDAPGAFNISFERPITFAELGGRQDRKVVFSQDLLYKISSIAYPLRLTKLSPDWVVAAMGEWRCDIAKAREILGWTPRHALAASLEEMRANIENKKWPRFLRR